ncbi:hypothetical protein V8C44DRAFT_353316 [Trichoderma aethiopicum]
MEATPEPQLLPIVKPLQRKVGHYVVHGLRLKLRNLRNNDLTPQIEVDFYDSLIRGIFRFVGADPKLYPGCFNACTKLCWDTQALHASSWIDWSGYFQMAWSMLRAQGLTEATNLLHLPPAPLLVVVIAMRQVILNDNIGPGDQKAEFLRKYDCNRKAVTAIHFFSANFHEEVLVLNQPWNTSLEVDQQPRPNCEIMQAAQANSTPPSSMAAVNRGRGNLSATPRSNDSRRSVARSPKKPPRAAVPTALPLRMTTPRPAATPVRRPFKARSAFILSPDSPAVSSSVRARSSPSLFVSPLPFRFASTPAAVTPAARRVRSPPPPPTPVPAPMFSSPLVPAPAPVQPSSTPVRETTKRVTRGEVMLQVRPLVNRLKHEGWNGSIQTDIMRVLTDKNVRVLPYFAKQTLRIWAEASRKHTIVGWLEQAKDDEIIFEWVERDAEPELEHEPEPEAQLEPESEADSESEAEAVAEAQTEAQAEPDTVQQTSRVAPSTLDVFHDLEAGIASISEPNAREQLQANLRSLKANLYTNDLKQREDMQHRIDQHDQIIRELQARMSGTQQTAANTVMEPAAVAASRLVTDSDEDKKISPSAAQRVVIVIEKSEQEAESAEGRKKRKRKSRMAKREESDAEVADSEEERRARREAKRSKKPEAGIIELSMTPASS